MKKDKSSKSNLVFSTDNRVCPGCLRGQTACVCKEKHNTLDVQGDGIARLHRETKGRKGKGVTLITGLPLPDGELKKLAKELKQHCGTGGSIKNGVIEIQGDQRNLLQLTLQAKGYQVKLSGG